MTSARLCRFAYKMRITEADADLRFYRNCGSARIATAIGDGGKNQLYTYLATRELTDPGAFMKDLRYCSSSEVLLFLVKQETFADATKALLSEDDALMLLRTYMCSAHKHSVLWTTSYGYLERRSVVIAVSPWA